MDADLKKALILGLALSQDSYQEEEIEDYYLKIGKLKDEIMLKNQEIMKFTQDNP